VPEDFQRSIHNNLGNFRLRTYDLDISGIWTVSFWTKTIDAEMGPLNENEFLWLWDGTLVNAIGISYATSPQRSLYVYIHDSASSYEMEWPSFFTEAIWTHVVVTCDGTGVVVWRDGVVVNGTIKGSEQLTDLAYSPRSIHIGGFEDDSNYALGGYLGPVAIWKSVLDEASIHTIRSGAFGIDLTANTGDYTQSLDLVAYWRPSDLDWGQTDRVGTANLGSGVQATEVISTDVPIIGPESGDARSLLISAEQQQFLRSEYAYKFGFDNFWSISYWAKAARASTTGNLFNLKGVPASRSNYILVRYSTSTQFDVILTKSNKEILKSYRWEAPTGNPKTRNWVHYVIVWNGRKLRAYFDGVEILPSTMMIDDVGTMNDFHNRTMSYGEGWDGYLGHLSVFNASLSQSDINEIFAGKHTIDLTQDSGGYSKSSYLQHYYRPGFASPSDIGTRDEGVGNPLVPLWANYLIDATDIVVDAP